jgi:hypothetical protein
MDQFCSYEILSGTSTIQYNSNNLFIVLISFFQKFVQIFAAQGAKQKSQHRWQIDYYSVIDDIRTTVVNNTGGQQ